MSMTREQIAALESSTSYAVGLPSKSHSPFDVVSINTLARQLLAAMDRLADADMAQAALVERAIQLALARARSHTGNLSAGSGRSDSRDAWLREEECKALAWEIRALAPDAGVKDLAALRAEKDAAVELAEERLQGQHRLSALLNDTARDLNAELAEARKQAAGLREVNDAARKEAEEAYRLTNFLMSVFALKLPEHDVHQLRRIRDFAGAAVEILKEPAALAAAEEPKPEQLTSTLPIDT